LSETVISRYRPEEIRPLPGKDETENLKRQCESLKKKLNQQNRWGLKPIAIGLGLTGTAILALWLLIHSSATASMLLVPTGASLLALAILLFYLSPSRYLRVEVSVAMMLTNALNVRNMLKSLAIESKGIIMPGDPAQQIVLLVPYEDLGREEIKATTYDSREMTKARKKRDSLWLNPPGFGLFSYARTIGAVFTENNLEEELAEVMTSSMELVRDVSLKIEGDRANVRLHKMATAGMCSAIREEDPAICTQTGCPLCSFVGCAIVDATGKNTRATMVKEAGDVIDITFELI
jgi:hypothetical protein